jgi:hypothetical protein
MTICKSFIDVICQLREAEIITNDEEELLGQKISKLLGYDCDKNITEISGALSDEINYVNHYKSEALFDDVEFRPRKSYVFGELSFKLVDVIRESCHKLEKVNFLLLLDEYENFLAFEQRIVNSSIKLSKNLSFRVGMRPMGFHSYATVSEDEFIKEHRDYRRVLFENPMIGKNDNGYLEFLLGIAKKRLSNVGYFSNKQMLDLKQFLGEKENVEEEARNIVKGRNTHIDEYLKEINKVQKNNFKLTDEKIQQLRCPENPLYEMQNMRMLLKPFDVEYVIKAFNDYKNKINSEEAQKYKNDYSNKYKLSYVFVLRSIYKVNTKQYYGFRDFAYLSSGIVGTFIELCRCTFQYAYFTDKEALLRGEITPDIQTKAVQDVANSEFAQIHRISKFGKYIYQFTKNIGTSFSKYHVDKRISYPETNQFSLNSKKMEENSTEEKVLNAAIMWSVVQKKKGMQQASIGKDDEEVYILNRIYAPIFQISVRTRGGFNVELDKDKFSELINNEGQAITIKETEDEDNKQISLFDFEWGNTDGKKQKNTL